jgi:hypothetical protein
MKSTCNQAPPDLLYARMSAPVATKDPTAVEAEVQAAYLAMFADGSRSFVPRVFGWAIECFTGGLADYLPVDASYHDFEHTLQGALCMARLLQGRHRAGTRPVLTQRLFELGITAILLHDTGYLKQRGDTTGTGAKYTVIHVRRSAEFATRLLAQKGCAAQEIQSVQNMISCTGVDAELEKIAFQSELERTVGFALATADLLGQMAADDYIDKLPELFAEFEEAAAFSHDNRSFVASFASVADLVSRTPQFWEGIVKPRLETTFGGVYRFLNDPYPEGPNPYVQRIERNMARLRQRLVTRPDLGSGR